MVCVSARQSNPPGGIASRGMHSAVTSESFAAEIHLGAPTEVANIANGKPVPSIGFSLVPSPTAIQMEAGAEIACRARMIAPISHKSGYTYLGSDRATQRQRLLEGSAKTPRMETAARVIGHAFTNSDHTDYLDRLSRHAGPGANQRLPYYMICIRKAVPLAVTRCL